MKLADYIAQSDITRPALAKAIGVSEVSVHRYLSGERIPRPATMARIAATTNGAVTANDFFTNTTTPAAALQPSISDTVDGKGTAGTTGEAA